MCKNLLFDTCVLTGSGNRLLYPSCTKLIYRHVFREFLPLPGRFEYYARLITSVNFSAAQFGLGGAMVAAKPQVAAIAEPPKKVADQAADLAEEADKIRKEYEEKMADLQKLYEKEQSSNQKLQEELDKLEVDYSDKLEKVQEKYDHATEAENIVSEFQSQGSLKKDEAVGDEATSSLKASPQAAEDDGAKAFKSKPRHSPSILQQIQSEAHRVQGDALKGLGTLKNKLVSGEYFYNLFL